MNMQLVPLDLFGMGAMSALLLGIVFQFYYFGESTIDIQVYDTLYVTPTFYASKKLALVMTFFFFVYYFFPKIFEANLNSLLGYIHFWLTFIPSFFLFYPQDYTRLAGMPRRYIDYGWSNFQQFRNVNRFFIAVSLLLLVAQTIFLFNFIFSLSRGNTRQKN